MNDSESIQRKLKELDVKLELLTQRTLAYVTTILQILHNQQVVGFREMLHYLRQNEKDFSKDTPSREDKEFFHLMRPLLEDDEWGNEEKKKEKRKRRKEKGRRNRDGSIFRSCQPEL